MRRILAATLVLLLAATHATLVAPPALAAGPDTIEIDGRGWGHGRGMSQYGAQGYARDHGWTFDRILAHYYGGTDYRPASQASHRPVDPSYVRVNLVANNGAQTITVGIGSASTFSISGAPVSVPAAHKGVQLRRNGVGWDVYSRATATSGTWTKLGTGGRIVTVGRASGSEQLQLHNSQGVTHYPGSIRAFTDGSKHRTVNITSAEEYLRGVVPREMPASWHLEALKVQAVAARSYLLAGDTRHTDALAGGYYADTCDTTMCQVYDGHVRNGTRVTHPATDAALAATSGQVMIRRDNGRIARTEFSSTSGGWTAGGDFPAVEDLGDAISPLHTWKVDVSVAPLESRCGSDFQRIEVTRRNGLGADGGRVLEANVVCANRTITATGNDIRSWLGLRSDWWSPLGAHCDPAGPEVAYIDAAHHLFVDRRATDAEVDRWCADVKAKKLGGITDHLATSDEWAGNRITGLYQHILGRGPDRQGYENWLRKVREGYTLREIATGIYASPEFAQRSGGTTRGYVERLYVLILGRSADAAGRDSWVRQIDSGQTNPRRVADGFYQSIESRRQRVTLLYRDILGRKPDPQGMETWTKHLVTVGDIRLAATLARSGEYYNRVT